MKKQIFTLLAIGLLSSVAFVVSAQQNNEQIPQGRWVFKSISAFENDKQLPSFNFEQLNFEIPMEMDIKSDEVIFVNKSGTNTMKRKSAVNGNLLCFYICAEWSVVDDMLQLLWFQSPGEGEHGGEKTFIVKYGR